MSFFISNSGKNSAECQLRNHPIWDEFLKDDDPVLIVIGDYYIYKVEDFTADNSHVYVRDYNINSDADFDEFSATLTKNKEKYHITNHTLLGKFAPWTASELTPNHASQSQAIRPETFVPVAISGYGKNNIIFVGTFKSLGIVNELIADPQFFIQSETKYFNLS